MSNHTVWVIVKRHWLNAPTMPKLTWNVTSATYNAASIIPALFSGHWVTKPVSDLILKLATVGSRMKIPAVPYNTNRRTETNLPTLTVPCMPITSIWKDMASVQMPRSLLSSVNMPTLWVTHRAVSKNIGI